MRIKFVSTVVAAVAVLAVSAASASATTMQYWDTVPAPDAWTNFATNNQNVDAVNSGSVTLTSAFGTVTCTSSAMDIDVDVDGTVDAGDVNSATYTGCSSVFFGFPVGATATVCNISSATGSLSGSTMSVNNTCTDINVGSGTCVMRVEGSITGSFADGTAATTGRGTATLTGAGGLSITSASGFGCQSAAPGDPADFTGTYKLSTVDGNGVTTSVRTN